MFKPSDILIDAYVERMRQDYRTVFDTGVPGHLECLSFVGRMALTRMAFTNAQYTNLTMTMLTTQVATDVLRGRAIGRGDVSSSDYLHFLAAALCYLLGFVRGAVKGDNGRTCVIDDKGATIELARGLSDGALYPWATERSKLFARQFFREHPLIDGERLADCIDYTEFPAPHDKNHDTGTWPGLLRGAQTIAVVADPRFTQRLGYFYRQLKEANVAERLTLHSAGDLFQQLPTMFWKSLYPRIADAIDYLKYTGDGLTWLASMNAHMLEEEHRVLEEEHRARLRSLTASPAVKRAKKAH